MTSVALALLLGCAVVACGGEKAPRGVVLLVVDTLRADHLGAYGYPRETSPHIDGFSKEATLFENALTPSPWTLPALATLMTSLPPTVHGARVGSKVRSAQWLYAPKSFEAASDLDASRTTLAEILSAEGFATAAFVQGAYPSRVFGFAQGFDRFDDNASPGLRFDVEEALAWLDDEQPERFFVYLHSTEVHSPYEPPERIEIFAANWTKERQAYYEGALAEETERFLEFDFDPGYQGEIDGTQKTLRTLKRTRGKEMTARDREHLLALYDRGIAYTDYWFGALLEGLRERGLRDDTVVILTSDHGEEFLEHEGMQHSRTYYDEVLRVPLIVRVPGVGVGKRIALQAGLADLLPTVLAALRIPQPEQVQGRSLLPLMRGESLPERLHFGEASVVPESYAVRSNKWKYIKLHRREELYDLQMDPLERNDRCASDGPTCARFRAHLEAWRNEMHEVEAAFGPTDATPAGPDKATRARLEKLGYIEEDIHISP